MKVVIVSLFAILSSTAFAHSEAEKSTVLADACKAECPSAKNDRQAHHCLKGLKRKGTTIGSAICADALKAHELDEKSHKKHK